MLAWAEAEEAREAAMTGKVKRIKHFFCHGHRASDIRHQASDIRRRREGEA